MKAKSSASVKKDKRTVLSVEEATIKQRLFSMKMSGRAEAFEEQVLNPNSDLDSFMDRFSALVNYEWQLRYDKKFNKYLKEAKLRYPQADFDESIYDPARKLNTSVIEKLSTCEWIDEGRNVIITGLTGSGKTYLSNAFCIAAIRQFKTVRYVRGNTLMLELEQARTNNEYLDYVNKISKYDLLAIDDFGLMDLDLNKCMDLFEVIDGRDGRKSTIIISQFPVKSWFDMFADSTYADAILSRITDRKHSYRIDMKGKNMRNPE